MQDGSWGAIWTQAGGREVEVWVREVQKPGSSEEGMWGKRWRGGDGMRMSREESLKRGVHE